MAELCGVKGDSLALVPSWAWDYIGRALARGGSLLDVETVRRLVADNTMQLWAAFDDAKRIVGLIVTEIRDWPAGRVCHVVGCGYDDLDGHFSEYNEQLEAWAKANGCKAFEVSGRKGWKRRLPGYRFAYQTLRKEL